MHAAMTGRGRALRIVLVLTLMSALTVVTPSATATHAPLTPFNIEVVGQSGGVISSVEATGNWIFAARGNALASYDVSTGDAVAAGSTLLPDHGGPTVVAGDRYYSAGANAFSIVDISIPGSPVFLGSAKMPSEAYTIEGMFADGDFVYVGYEKYDYHGMKVFDVSDPVAPVVMSAWGQPAIGAGEVLADAAYVVTPYGDVDVLDISTAGEPDVATTLVCPQPIADICILNGYLYAVTHDADTGEGSIVPFDLNDDPLAPVQCAPVGTPALSVDAAGVRLWTLSADGMLASWDIATDPAAPTLSHEAPVSDGNFAAFAAACVAVLSADEMGSTVTVVVDSAASLVTTSSIYGDYGDTAVALTEGWAFITAPAGVRAVDTSQTGFPTVSDVGMDSPADIVLSADSSTAFVGTPDELAVVDISDPYSISVATTLAVVGGIERLALADDGSVLFAVAADALHAIDVTDPSAPVLIDSATLTDPACDVFTAGDRVWVTLATSETGGLLVEYDASTPTALEYLTDHGLPGGMPSVTVDNGYAFVGLTDPNWGGSGTKVFDVSDPGSLAYLYYHSLGDRTATDVTAANGELLSVGEGGMLLTGVYEPSLAYTLGYLPLPGMRVERLGDFIATTHEDGGTTFAAYAPVSFRTFGGNRYDTAIAMSQTFDSSEYVVLATGRSYPDALAGVPLAYALNAPILLTDASYIPADVVAEIERLGATKAIVLGGTAALSDAVVTQLQGMGFAAEDIERIDGATRYETAKEIALRLELIKGEGAIDKVFVATGKNFPDALAAAGVAARSGCPILLVKPDDPNIDTLAAIDGLGATDTVIVGGTMVVSPQVAATLPSPERLSGTTRFDTAVVIADWAMNDPTAAFSASELFVVTGLNFPDALSSGVVAASHSAPTLLMSDAQPTATLEFVREHSSEIDSVSIIGGTAAVSSVMEHWIATYAGTSLSK